MENKNRQDSEKDKNEQTQENTPQNSTRSDSDLYKRTMIGTGAQKSDENFDSEHRQTNEKDLEDRDNNDGDANTENNY